VSQPAPDPDPPAPLPQRLTPIRSSLVSSLLHALGCLGSLGVAFLAASAAGFAAWMTALPEGMRTMSLEAARRQFYVAAAVFLVACVAGIWLLVRVVQRARRSG
jgi:hypothetical protein